jgi:hypothetical protein
MIAMYPWTAVRYDGASRDTRIDRRRRLWAWRDGAVDMVARDAQGRELTIDAIDWTGCERPRGRPWEAGSRGGSPILVRVSDDERERLQSAADEAGEPLSTWVRDVALRAANAGEGSI